jgi:hypothetical protein
MVLALAAFMGEDEEIATVLDVAFEVVQFGGGEGVTGGGDHKEMRFFNPIEVHLFLIEADLDVQGSTL